jgi:virulence-associated protein VapD
MKNIFKKHNKKKLSAIALISIICLHFIYQSIMAYKVSLNTLGDDIIIVNVYRASPFDKFFNPSTFKSKRYLQDKEAFQIAKNYCNFKEDNDVYLFAGKDDQNKPSFVDGAEFKGIGNHIYDQVASLYKWKFRFFCSPDLNTALTKYSDNLENFKTSIDGPPVSFHIKSRDQQTLITPELLQQKKKSTEKKETTEKKDKREVEESNIDEAWKVDGKFIIPECFDYIWVSGDRYETFYDEYFEKPEGSHWDNPKFKKFTENVGMYLNKEVPLNHSIDPDWDGYPKISLTKQLEGCLSEKPETSVRFTNEFNSPSTIAYKVMHNFDPYFAKELAPYIDQKFESVKQVEIVEWGGGSMGPQTHMVVFGVLELEGKKVLLPLRNKSILTEIGKRDTFFRGNGRFSYEAEFDLNDDITKIININDFKQMVSSDGCFKINDFATDGKIYNFLNKNKLKTYCNEVRPFDDINWFLKQREFKTNQDLIYRDKEHRFSNLIRSQVPDIQVPWVDDSYRLAEELIVSITFEDDIQYLENGKQVVVSGCVYKFCTQKGFIFVYQDNFIGLIQHGAEEFDVDDFFVFSKNHKNFIDLPDSFFVAVKAWIKKTNSDYGSDVIKPETIRFVGTDNKIKKVDNLFANMKSTTKCVAGDCINGTGVYMYKDGSKYSGKFKNGKRDGFGNLKLADGTEFIGQSKQDVFYGNGTIMYPSGDKYVGEIKNNKREGKGTYTFKNGLTSSGEWKDNKAVGKHTTSDTEGVAEKAIEKMIEEDGGVFVKVTKTYEDGSKYVGTLNALNQKKHGKGKFTRSDGFEYEGEFKNDLFHGKGTNTVPNGMKYTGDFKKWRMAWQRYYYFS